MSIVKALNELSGKEANTIEKAIRNIELGGGGGSGILFINIDGGVLSRTWQEIRTAVTNGTPVFVRTINEVNTYYTDLGTGTETSTPTGFYDIWVSQVTSVGVYRGEYYVHIDDIEHPDDFTADSPDDYPSITTTQQEPEGS